jgi:hypothetical protein
MKRIKDNDLKILLARLTNKRDEALARLIRIEGRRIAVLKLLERRYRRKPDPAPAGYPHMIHAPLELNDQLADIGQI